MNELKTRERVLRNNTRRAAIGRAYIDAAKAGPCTDCGLTFDSVCMSFDHLGDKYLGVSQMLCFSVERIQEEIDKCELVCHNCHAIRTRDRR
jgi:hypothetical protein